MSKKIPLSRKIRITLAAGAIPSTTIAAIGDFFSPKGGWILPIALGAITFVILLTLLLLGTRHVKKVTDGDEDLEGWWDGVRYKQLGVWTLAAFSGSALVFGWFSYSKAQAGGVLSNAVPLVASAQQTVGLLEKSIELQGRTADATEAIRDTVKRETSDNPRKELANMGVVWSAQSFAEALEKRDLETVDLFLQAAMRLDEDAMRAVLVPNPLDQELAGLLLDNGARADSVAACTHKEYEGARFKPMTEVGLMQHITGRPNNPDPTSSLNVGIDPEKAQLWAALCDLPGVKEELESRIEWWSRTNSDEEKSYYNKMLGYLE